ncbi:MAG: tetratricopeptide repeat protein [Anaerolineae bacterium]|nr:tetratricopeptide repeat protein [Anaerolineae bacterium]
MSQVLNVFISSRMMELKAEREALNDLLPRLSTPLYQVRAWVFEDTADASNRTIREIYLDGLRHCALYLGIFAQTYGEWTIDEFHYATRWGMDRHIYVRNTAEDAQSREARLQEFLDQHTGVETGITSKWFSTVVELCESVTSATNQWIKTRVLSQVSYVDTQRITSPDDLLDLPRRFFGQRNLLDQGLDFLNQGELVQLFGEAGIGKTASASMLVSLYLKQVKEVVLWVRAGSADFSTVINSIGKALGLSLLEVDQPTILKILRQALKNANVGLVAIDDVTNYDTVHQISKVVPKSTKLLVISRLRFPNLRSIQVEPLEMPYALELLGAAAGQDFTNDATAEALCTSLTCNPYALLLAGYTMVRSGLSTADMLSQSIKQIRAGDSSMTGLIEASLSPLYLSTLDEDKDAYSAFMAIGAFPGYTITPELLALYFYTHPQIDDEYLDKHGWYMSDMGKEMMKDFSRRAASDERSLFNIFGMGSAYSETIMRSLDVKPFQISLTLLARRGLLRHVSATSTHAEYYHMNAITGAYASAQLTDDQRKRALNACATFVSYHKTKDSYPHLAPHLDNFMKLFRWAANHPHPLYTDDIKMLTTGLLNSEFLFYQGLFREAVELLQVALERAIESKNSSFEARIRNELGAAFIQLGEPTEAMSVLEQAQPTENKEAYQTTLGHLGLAYFEIGDYSRAKEAFTQAADIAKELHHPSEAAWEGNLGLIAYEQRQFADAQRHHQRSIELHRELNNHLGEANELGNLANIVTSLGQYERALELHTEALTLHRSIKYRRGEGKDIGNIGNVYMLLRQYDAAFEHFTAALKIASELNAISDVADWLYSLGALMHRQRQFPTASRYYRQAAQAYTDSGSLHKAQPALQLAERADRSAPLRGRNTIEISSILGGGTIKIRANSAPLDQARELMIHGKLEEALSLARPGLETARVMEDWLNEYDHLDLIGTIEYSRGNHQLSLMMHQNALIVALENEDIQRFGTQLSNTARAYLEQGNHEEARKRYEHALEIARATGNTHAIGVRLGSLGLVYQNLKDYPNAEKYLREALDIARQIEDPRAENNRLGNLGLVAFVQEDYEKAETYLTEALKIARVIGDGINIFNWLNNLSNVYIMCDNYAQALIFAMEAIQVASQLDNVHQLSTALLTAGTAHRLNQQYVEAKQKYQEALTLAEKSHNEGKIKEIHNLLSYTHALEVGLDNQIQKGDEALDAEDYPGALMIYRDLLEAVKTEQNQGVESMVMMKIALTYAHMGELDKALQFTEQADLLATEAGLPEMESGIKEKIRRLLQNQQGLLFDGIKLPPISVTLNDLRPVPTTTLIGRETPVQMVREALETERRVMLVGASGVGKSSIAEKIAGEANQVIWFNAHGNDPDFLVAEFCLFAGQMLNEQPPSAFVLEPQAFVSVRLAQFALDALFVLDDVSNSDVLQNLLKVIPSQARTLITCVEPVDGSAHVIEISPLNDDEETKLIQERAGLFATRKAIRYLTEKVGNMALKVDIAARLLRERNEVYILEQASTDIFEWVYSALSEDLQVRYRLLGVLPSGMVLTIPLLAGLWEINLDTQEGADEVDYTIKVFASLGLLITRDGLFYLHGRVAQNAAARLSHNEAEEGLIRIWYRLASIGIQELGLAHELWGKVQPYFPHFRHYMMLVLERFNQLDLEKSATLDDTSMLEAKTLIDDPVSPAILRYLQSIAPLINIFNHWRIFGMQLMQTGLALSRARGDKWYEAFFLNWIAVLHSDTDDTQTTARLYFESALGLAAIVGDKRLEGEIQHNLGYSYLRSNQLEPASGHLRTALKIRQFFEDSQGETSTISLIAIYLLREKPHEAMDLLNRAMNLCAKLGMFYRQIVMLNEQGLLYDNLNQRNLAIEIWEKAIRLARQHHFIELEGSLLTNLSDIYWGQHEYAMALSLAEMAADRYKRSGNQRMEAHALNGLGLLYKAVGQPEKSPAQYQQAIILAQASSAKGIEATSLNNLAGVYWDQQDYQQALKLYEQSYFLNLEIDHLGNRLMSLSNMAILYLDHLGHPFEAAVFLEFVLDVAKSQGAYTRLGSINLQNVQFNLWRAKQSIDSTQDSKVEFDRVKMAVQHVLNSDVEELFSYIDLNRDLILTPLADILFEYAMASDEQGQKALQTLREVLFKLRHLYLTSSH